MNIKENHMKINENQIKSHENQLKIKENHMKINENQLKSKKSHENQRKPTHLTPSHPTSGIQATSGFDRPIVFDTDS